jgi:hypothetical protein
MSGEKEDAVPNPWGEFHAEEAAHELDFSFAGLDSPDSEPAVEPEIQSEIQSEVQSEVQSEILTDDIATWLGEPSAAADATQAEAPSPHGSSEHGRVEEDGSEADAVAEWPAVESPHQSFGQEQAFEDVGIDALSVDDALVGAVGLAAVSAVGETAFAAEPAAVLPASEPRFATKGRSAKRSGGGVIGTIVGGLLSIPVVFLILLGVLWGTGRDPLNLRDHVPAFLLPPRGVAMTSSAPVTESSMTLDEAVSAGAASESSGETAVTDAVASAADTAADAEGTPATEPGPATTPQPSDAPSAVPMADEPSAVPVPLPALAAVPLPAIPALDPFGAPPSPVPVVPAPTPPEPEPLDLSGVEVAIADALEAMDRVPADDGVGGAGRRRALVAWYKSLARVGEQLAAVETVAADSGRPLEETPAAIRSLYDRIASADDLGADLERLCRNWVDFSRRPADGVLLVGGLESLRQVGPYWHASVGLAQSDGSVRQVTAIARRRPQAEVGERVGVIGIVFSGDVVWAADCGRWEAVAVADPF